MADFTEPFRAFVDDPIGKLTRSPDNGNRAPQTKVQTSYSILLKAQVGAKRAIIGAVHEFSPQQTLSVDEEFEVNSFGKGLPRELVPQALTGRTIRLARYELYQESIEAVFGLPELLTLADQTGPISLILSWKDPNATALTNFLPQTVNTQRNRAIIFSGCYLTSLGKTYSTQNVIVGADATLVWTNIQKHSF